MLRDQNAPGVYLATVEPTGVFQFLRQGAHTRQLRCEATLNVEELLRLRHRPTTPLVDRDKQLSPAIFREARFPLFVPANRVNYRQCRLDADRGVFEIAIEVLCDAASDPVAGFSAFGHVVLVNGSRCENYLRARRHHELRTTRSIAATPALAVLAMPRGDQILVCGKRGDVHLLSLR